MQINIYISCSSFKIAIPDGTLIKGCRQFTLYCFYRLMVYILIGFLSILHISGHSRLVGEGQIHGPGIIHITGKGRPLAGIYCVKGIFACSFQIPRLFCMSSGQI